LKGANLIHAAVGIAMSLLFALISLVLAVADGSDLNPHSKAYYASPCGKWTFRRAFIKSALPILAAALPNYIHLRVNISLPSHAESECALVACFVSFLLLQFSHKCIVGTICLAHKKSF